MSRGLHAKPLRPVRGPRYCRTVTDLKRKGMFEDTLIVWGGEFGRTPMAQRNKGAGS